MICGRRLKGVAPQPSVSMAGIPIPQVKIHKHLGVIFNDTLTWSNHIDKVYERCAQRVGILRRLRRTFPSHALHRIYVGAVLPIMEYACPEWSGGPVAKLIHLHESFCRRNQTSLPPLQKRFDFHTLVLFYKINAEKPDPFVFVFSNAFTIVHLWISVPQRAISSSSCE